MESADLINNPLAITSLNLDLSSLSPAELAERVISFQTLRSQVEAAEMRALHAARERRIHSTLGFRTDASWMTAEKRQHRSHVARRHNAAYTVVEHLPMVLAELEKATISADHVNLLLTAERRGMLEPLIEDQKILLRWAMGETYETFREFFEAWCIINDPNDPSLLDERAFNDRKMIWVDGVDGAVLIQVDTTNLHFAQLLTSLQPIYDRLLENDWARLKAEHGPEASPKLLTRTDQQRWHDALLALARAGAGMEDPGAEFVVNIVVDEETLSREANQAAGTEPPLRPAVDAETYRAETLGGLRLSPSQILTWALAGHIRRVVRAADGVDFSISRRTRLFPAAMRLGLIIRDRHCQGAGCSVPAIRCQADHIDPYSRAGPTTPANGNMLCPACHRHKTKLESYGLAA